MRDDKPSPVFKADEVCFTDEGLVFICPDEAQAQRAYCEGLLKGRKVKLDGKKLIMLRSLGVL